MTKATHQQYDLNAPWNVGVNGNEVLPLISDDAPVLRTEAGPGTGKTFGLRRRVLRLMHPEGAGVSGEKVVVVAFNRVIAKELQKDIESTLKEWSISDTPVIHAVHGFCLRVLGEEETRRTLTFAPNRIGTGSILKCARSYRTSGTCYQGLGRVKPC